jgi:hypothetical protein
MVREAYPLNHFAEVAFCALAVFALAQTRSRMSTVPDIETKHELRCLAAAMRQQEAEAFLARLWPDPASTCDGVELPQ